MTPAVVSMAYRQEHGLPWHRTGVSVEGFINACDLARQAGQDYEVIMSPMKAILPDGTEFLTGDGGIFSNRTGNWQHINTVKRMKNYELVQNMEIAGVLDSRIDDDHPALSDIFEMDTAGVLNDGQQTFICFRIGEDQVKIGVDGYDEYQTHGFVLNDFSGNGTLQWGISSTRIVCWNTAMMALMQSEEEGTLWTFSHRSNPMAWLQYRAALEHHVQEARAKFYAKLQRMVDVKWTEEDVDKAVEKIYPLPPVPSKVSQRNAGIGFELPDAILEPIVEMAGAADKKWEQNTQRAKDNQAGLKERMEYYFDENGDRSKYWGFQGATDFVGWREPERGSMKQVGESMLVASRRKENDRVMKVFGLLNTKRSKN